MHPISDSDSVNVSSTDNIPLGCTASDVFMAESGDPHAVIWQQRSIPGDNEPSGLFKHAHVAAAEDVFFASMHRIYGVLTGGQLSFWWRCSSDIKETTA